jgi:phosphate-selective porin OprO and OprP
MAGKMIRAFLCAALSVLIGGRLMAQQPAPADGTGAKGSLPIQPVPANNRQAEEIRQLKAAVSHLQEQVKQLSNKSSLEDNQERVPQPIQSIPLFNPLCHDGLPPTKTEDESSWRMHADWKDGLWIATANDAFRIHPGGMLQFDAGWNAASRAVQFGPGGIGELQDGALFRRARIRIDGTMYEHIDWAVEFDFANDVENDTTAGGTPIGSPSFKNVWVAVNDLPLVGTARAGWMKEPIGFEHLTSSRFLNFMERAPGNDSLGLHSPGIMLQNTAADERITWAAGFFHAQNDNFGFGFGDGEYAETGRVTALPWYADDGRQLLHVGFGFSHRHLADNQIDLHGRPSVRTMPGTQEPSLAETGTIAGTSQEVLDVELAGVFGPWTLQSEYSATFIHDAVFPAEPPPMGMPRGTLFYQGAYVEILYFLTGEHRAYDRKAAVFDRVVPCRNFNIWGDAWGWGAWQVGVRYTYLDLQNKGVNGATLNDIVLGLNWFWNPNMKIQWNFAFDHREPTPTGSAGWTYVFGTRLAMDF